MSPSRLRALARRAAGHARATFDPSCRASFERAGDYLARHDCLSYTGWVGHGNLGDEWIFDSLQALLSPYRLLASEWGITPQMRLYSALFFGRSHPFRARILGGGTLFPRAGFIDRSAHRELAELPLFVLGLGALDDSFWRGRLTGDFSDENMTRWGELLRAARFVGVRDEGTAEAMRSIGVAHAKVVGDPALMIGDRRWREGDRGPRTGRKLRIGLNLGSHDPIWGNREELLRATAGFVLRCAARGIEVTFIPLSPGDKAEALSLQALLPSGSLIGGDSRFSKDRTLAGLLGQDVIVGQRLHSVVAASAFGIPSISLAYNPKCLRFMESFGRSEWAIRTDECSESVLESRVDVLLSSYETQSDLIWERAEHFRRLLRGAGKDILHRLSR